jgi:predicted DNA binding CopG/RHH family protein
VHLEIANGKCSELEPHHSQGSKTFQDSRSLHAILLAMQQATTPAPSSQSFAGFMAALSSPAPMWDDDQLEDDVATISYERALRSHARYQKMAPADLDDRSPLQVPEAALIPDKAAQVSDQADFPAASTSQKSPHATILDQPEAPPSRQTALEKNLKSASITIRLSRAESAQLRQRAAEAGLTISAYLRSCTFEAESLRALVKDTLAQLRSKPSDRDQLKISRGVSSSTRRSWLRWLLGFLPRWSSRQRTVQA